jgi:hypothetical protein
MCGSFAFADDAAFKPIADAAQREARDIISSELFGHYDITDLAVVRTELQPGRAGPQPVTPGARNDTRASG